MKQYKLTQDFAGFKAGDVLDRTINGYMYSLENDNAISVHFDIINALPEIFKPIPQKKTVWISVESKKNYGVYTTSCAYDTEEGATGLYDNVYKLEIEVND